MTTAHRQSHKALEHAVHIGKPVFLSMEGTFGIPMGLILKRQGILNANSRNSPLQQELRRCAYPDGRAGHYRHNVSSVHGALSAIRTIEHAAGKEFFKNVHSAFQGFTLPYDRFFVDTEQKQKDLFIDTYLAARMRDQHYGIDVEFNRCAYALPRLLRFKPSPSTRNGRLQQIESCAIDVTQDLVNLDPAMKEWHRPERRGRPAPQHYYSPNKRIIMRHVIHLPDDVQPDPHIFERDLYILASPHVLSTDVSQTYNAYKRSKRQAFSFKVLCHWTLASRHMMTSAKGHRVARIPNPRQLQLL